MAHRTLKEMFLSEATLEFPDSEIAAVTRVVQSATRAGRLPRDAAENWPISTSGKGGKPAAKPTVRPKAPTPAAPASGDRSGRLVPSQSSLRSGSPSTMSHEPPSALRKFMGGGKAADAKSDDGEEPGPSKGQGQSLKRLYSKARGRDPDNDLPKPKPAAFKVHGKGNAFPDIPDRPERLRGQAPEDQPLFNVPGVTDVPDDNDQEDKDGAVSAIKKGLSAAGRHGPTAGRRNDFPEADVWDKFAGPAGAGDEESPPPKGDVKKKQGRLSRLFKGRRDDGI